MFFITYCSQWVLGHVLLHVTDPPTFCINSCINKHIFSLDLACKLSIDMKTWIFIPHPQFTFNSPAHIELNANFKTHRDAWMLTVHLCNHTNNCACTHTHTVVGGKGNPLRAFFSSSYECLSDIKASRSAASGPSSGFSSRFININGRTFRWDVILWSEYIENFLQCQQWSCNSQR